MKKMKQTAGRDQLGDTAPKFAELNDDVLFGQIWERKDILSLRNRSVITITSLITSGIIDNSLKYHIQNAKNNGVTKTEMAEIITHLAFYAGWPKAWAAFPIFKEVYSSDSSSRSYTPLFGTEAQTPSIPNILPDKAI